VLVHYGDHRRQRRDRNDLGGGSIEAE
jgi:hypothetical protein